MFQIPNKSTIMRRDSREDIGHSSVWNSQSYTCRNIEFYRYTDPVSKSISALSRGIQNTKNNRDTMHFNADSSNTELLFRSIHSGNQLSICGVLSSWCEEYGLRPSEREMTSERFVAGENEQLLMNVKPQEVKLLVQTPRCSNPVSGKIARMSSELRNTGERNPSV